jgi:DNA-binding response OmpR family regulator
VSQAAPASKAPVIEPGSAGAVLVVDDVPENIEVLTRRLAGRGFATHIAKRGQQALEIAGATALDLVLLDVMMPEMSGLDTLKALRTRFNAAQLPVIMVTARDDQPMMVHCFAAGANDYIIKPFDFGITLARISAQLRVRQAWQETAARLAVAERKLAAR